MNIYNDPICRLKPRSGRFTESEDEHTATLNLRAWHCCRFPRLYRSPALSSNDLLLIIPLPSPQPLMHHWWVNSKRRWLRATKPWEDSKRDDKKESSFTLQKHSCCLFLRVSYVETSSSLARCCIQETQVSFKAFGGGRCLCFLHQR